MKRHIATLVAVAGLTLNAAAEDVTISAESFLAMRVAYDEFRRQLDRTDIGGYVISVTEKHGSIVVSFMDASPPPGLRGSSPDKPGLTVEIAKDSLKVIRAHFHR